MTLYGYTKDGLHIMGHYKRQQIDKTEPIRPVCLDDLKQDGLLVFCWCNRCSHHAELSPDAFIPTLGRHFPVPELGQHMRCSHCRARDVTTRPAWPSHGGQIARHG